jgi:hypothetical protein
MTLGVFRESRQKQKADNNLGNLNDDDDVRFGVWCLFLTGPNRSKTMPLWSELFAYGVCCEISQRSKIQNIKII